jgi:3-methyladenine DNA glycosylase AlkD
MTSATAPGSAASGTTALARAFVAAHLDEATALGREAGELVGSPAELVAHLRAGLARLADPTYLEGQDRVAPGIGPIAGVRQPLLHATTRAFMAAMREDRSSTVLDVAGQLLRAELLELHWIAFGLLERTILEEPERSWQLARAAAGRADNWITVDSLAHVTARGILAETYRWAELEQLVYSPSRWERRLVGSTIAVIPSTDRTAGRTPDVARRGLALVRDLVGDAEPDVQKALSWALRSMSVVDRDATVAFLRAEAAQAAATNDGHRAWVVRDSLEKLPAPIADELRHAIDAVRKRPNAPTTSRAAETAAAFIGLGVDVPPADRPIVERP